jgi:16S rRNA (uracil1498-N3)-methyltransferase
VDRDASEARIEARLSMWGEPKLRLTVATAVPKGSRMEFAIEKGTELGVSRFVPLRTRRSIAGVPPGKIERWRRLALAAMKQSRRSVLPEVTHETSLPEVLTSVETVPLKFIADSAGQDIRQASIRGPKSDATEAVVLIGPEGGFTDDELSQAVEAGFVPLALGPRRLRVETAAVVAATLILHAVGELEPLLGEASW